MGPDKKAEDIFEIVFATNDGKPVRRKIDDIPLLKDIGDEEYERNRRLKLEHELAKIRFDYEALKIKCKFRTIPDRIIKSGPATIVFWADGSKTVVRCAKGTEPDDYTAFCAALAKRVYGNNSAIKRAMRTAMVNDKQK